MAGVLVWDTHEIYALAAKLTAAGAASVPTASAVVTVEGESLRAAWASAAASSSGAHGVHYPKSITSRPRGLSAEVGPETGMQAAMSFEYGSRNQPPHLDGEHSADAEEPKFVAAMEKMGVAALSL